MDLAPNFHFELCAMLYERNCVSYLFRFPKVEHLVILRTDRNSIASVMNILQGAKRPEIHAFSRFWVFILSTNSIIQLNSSEFYALFLSYDSHLEIICSKLYKGTYFKHNLYSMYNFRPSLWKFVKALTIEYWTVLPLKSISQYFLFTIKRLLQLPSYGRDKRELISHIFDVFFLWSLSLA